MTTLKERYNTDPAYKQKHLNYVNKKVICPLCNVETSRGNFTKHEKTRKHIINLNATLQNKTKYDDLINQLQSLNITDSDIIENMTREINKLRDENESTWKKIKNI